MNNKEVIVYHGAENSIFNTTFSRPEWAILNRTVVEHEVNKIIYLEFIVILKRNTDFYGKSTLY